MRRLLVVLMLLPVAAAAGAGAKVSDGKDCRESQRGVVGASVEPGVVDEPGNVENADRGAYCVKSGSTTVFYIGGEAAPEQESNRGFAGLCGVLIVMDTSYGSEHPDANANPDDWDWDHTHPGPDGEVGTEDDEIHHHDCN